RHDTMTYAFLIYEPRGAYPHDESAPIWKAMMAACEAYMAELKAAGVKYTAHGFKPTDTSTTLRLNGGKRTIHHGRFAETRAELGGYWVLELQGLDEALAWARKTPLVEGAALEIRPIYGVTL